MNDMEAGTISIAEALNKKLFPGIMKLMNAWQRQFYEEGGCYSLYALYYVSYISNALILNWRK